MTISTSFSALPWPHRALLVLLLVNCIWVGVVFPVHALAPPFGWGMRAAGAGLTVLALLSTYAVWRQKTWGPWWVLAVVSGTLTVDVYLWSTGFDRMRALAGAALATLIFILAFRIGEPATKKITWRQRIFFAIVAGFAAWVAVGGMVLPSRIGEFLPLILPPLHARIIGAMYLAGAIMALLSVMASAWHQVRLVPIIVTTWAGVLVGVSFMHLNIFNWSGRPTWFWWIASIWFTIGMAFVAWNQRRETAHAHEPALSFLLRGFLSLQGGIAVGIALVLLFAPDVMVKLWPWTITPLLAKIYSGPFIAFGIGNLYCSHQHGWSQIRIPAITTLVLTVGAVIGSFMHSNLFNTANASTWVWFGGLGCVALGHAAFIINPRWRARA